MALKSERFITWLFLSLELFKWQKMVASGSSKLFRKAWERLPFPFSQRLWDFVATLWLCSPERLVIGNVFTWEVTHTKYIYIARVLKLEYSSEHAQLQNSKDSSQIECSIWFLHQRAISNCRQYCFGLVGLISAMLMLRWRWSFKSHLEILTNVVAQSCQSAQTRVL